MSNLPNLPEQHLHNMSPSDQSLRRNLFKELKSFSIYGILLPIYNVKLSPQDHYTHNNTQPVRLATNPLFSRIQNISIDQKEAMFPDIYDPIIIKQIKNTKTPAWLGDTITTRKKYDQWYWKTRLSLTPFNNAYKLGMNPLMTKLQRRAHDFHIEAAIQRNKQLDGQPKWSILKAIEW